MDGVVPGFVSKLLNDPTVALFRADERVFEEMLDGWRAQMLARGLTEATIEGRCGLVAGSRSSRAIFRGSGGLRTSRSFWLILQHPCSTPWHPARTDQAGSCGCHRGGARVLPCHHRAPRDRFSCHLRSIGCRRERAAEPRPIFSRQLIPTAVDHVAPRPPTVSRDQRGAPESHRSAEGHQVLPAGGHKGWCADLF